MKMVAFEANHCISIFIAWLGRVSLLLLLLKIIRYMEDLLDGLRFAPPILPDLGRLRSAAPILPDLDGCV